MFLAYFFFFKQKTAYEIYQCDWSSDVCSSDLGVVHQVMIPMTEVRRALRFAQAGFPGAHLLCRLDRKSVV